MLVFISLYQIAIGIVSLFLFIRSVIEAYRDMTNGQLFIAVLVTVFLVYYLYTNFCMLFSKVVKKLHLQFNIWMNFVQMVQLTLLSVSFKIVLGMEVAPYLLYSEKVSVGVKYDIFDLRLNLSYDSTRHDLSIAVNIIPLIFFLILNARYNKKDSNPEMENVIAK